MNLQPFYEFMLVIGWIMVALAGVMGVIGLVSIYHDHVEKRRVGSVAPERRVGAPDRRAHAKTR